MSFASMLFNLVMVVTLFDLAKIYRRGSYTKDLWIWISIWFAYVEALNLGSYEMGTLENVVGYAPPWNRRK